MFGWGGAKDVQENAQDSLVWADTPVTQKLLAGLIKQKRKKLEQASFQRYVEQAKLTSGGL